MLGAALILLNVAQVYRQEGVLAVVIACSFRDLGSPLLIFLFLDGIGVLEITSLLLYDNPTLLKEGVSSFELLLLVVDWLQLGTHLFC